MSHMKNALMDCAEDLDGLIQSIDLWWRLNRELLSSDRNAQLRTFKAIACLHEVRSDLPVPMSDAVANVIADGVLADLGCSEKGETRPYATRRDGTRLDKTGRDWTRQDLTRPDETRQDSFTTEDHSCPNITNAP